MYSLRETFLRAVVALGLSLSIAAGVVGQAPSANELGRRITAKQQEVEAHTKMMGGITEQNTLNLELRRHFLLTEELVALMLEERRLLAAQQPSATTGAPAAAKPGRMAAKDPTGNMAGKEPMTKMGGMNSGGSMAKPKGHGEMHPESEPMMAAMPTDSTPPMRPMNQAGGKAAMPGMPASDSAIAGADSTAAHSHGGDLDAVLKRITAHSKYLETITDQPELTRELFRHQQMLDELLRKLRP